MKNTATCIALCRRSCGLTQAQLAKKLGVSKNTVSAWEIGLFVPSLKYVFAMSLIFDICTMDLMPGEWSQACDIVWPSSSE